MDKYIEKLGRIRLDRHKRKKYWMLSVLLLAVFVLGITGYQLIQPASAADKDQCEYTVDKDTATYKNLAKLGDGKATALSLAEGNMVDWDGQKFNMSVALDFQITKDEADSSGDRYYYSFPADVYISDGLCEKWYEHQDKKGDYAFSYHFVKNEDNTYALLIKFEENYISDDISAGIKFDCSADGKVENDGKVLVSVGNEVYITVDSDKINWDKDTSVNYDISVEKKNTTEGTIKNDENGRKYIEYTLDISSKKGTPDKIDVHDVLWGTYLAVDTDNVVVSVQKNGRELSNNEYVYKIGKDGENYVLDTFLPKLNANESYLVTYRYYVDVINARNENEFHAENNVQVSSEDKNSHEKVIDTSKSVIKYKKSIISKSGEYKNGKIEWTIKVNSSKENIAGFKVTDEMFKKVYSVDVHSDTDYTNSYDINKNPDGTIASVVFKGSNGSDKNNNFYTIKYTTDQPQSFTNTSVNNTVIIEKEGDRSDYTTGVQVPGTGSIEKKLINADDDTANNRYKITWQSTIYIPQGGIEPGIEIRDTLSAADGSKNHFMTYDQLQYAFSILTNRLGDRVGEFKVVATDGNTYNWSAVNNGSFFGYTGFSFKTLKYISYNEVQKIEFTYTSMGDYSSGSYTTYRNRIAAGDISSDAEYSKNNRVKKTDGNGQQGRTVVNVGEDGKLTWRVEVLMDGESNKYVLADKMPKGVTVNSVSVELLYNNGGDSRYTIPTLDGVPYRVDINSNYWTGGIEVNSFVDAKEDGALVTTRVEKVDAGCRGWQKDQPIYVTYVCTMDGFENLTPGVSYEFKNKVSVSTERIDNYGEAWQTQVISKPKKEEIKDEEHEAGEEILDKQYVWNGTDRILNYSVSINPQGKDLVENCEELTLKDVLTYDEHTYDQADAIWKVHVIPTTVALYKAEVRDDGKLKCGEHIKDWSWTYEETKGKNYGQLQDIITAKVPDSTPMILKYSYAVTATKFDVYNQYMDPRIKIQNEASLEGVSNSNSSSDANDRYVEEKTSAYIYKNNEYIFYKVEKDHYENKIEGAEFTLYKYDPKSKDSNKTKDGYVPYKTYKTDESGSFTVPFKLSDFNYNRQYYIVETKAALGYLLPEKPEKYYFYYKVSDNTKYPVNAPNNELKGKDLSDGYGFEFVENEKVPTTSIDVTKKWCDSNNGNIIRTGGSIFVQVYQIQKDNSAIAYGTPVEIKPDSKGRWKYSVDDLPARMCDKYGNLTDYEYRYFVKETGVDESHQLGGYEVSYVYQDNDGSFAFSDKDGKSSVSGIKGGTVEITNKEISYELPATGGSGLRWLYMLSGVILVLFAGVSLIYKNKKENY